MSANNLTAVADAIALGTEAARRWTLSTTHGEAGDSNAIVALVHAQRVIDFTATVERKKEEETESFEFDVLSFRDPYWNNDGSKDTRKMAARTSALALRLFGIDELTNAHKTRLSRCVKSAIYLLDSLSALEDDKLFEAVTLKGGKLVAPYGLVKPEPKEDASDNEKAIFEVMKEKPLTLDGKDDASLAQLSRRANPPSANRAAGEAKDKGASFASSVDYVTAIVRQWNNPEGETDSAPNKELEAKLFALSQEIAAYFVANPVEEAGKKAA